MCFAWYSLIHLGEKRHYETKESCQKKKTTQYPGRGWDMDGLIQSPAH